ncbi:FtsW/RodA/SpoVE family cell cycle protein [Candidatus Dojkabacteria bacterium]|uniref:FtsW/RodA/SpoVE family cell cycle protein n=1 Tax=Candidatus Dojkabacteria bacterium TaxID=2099670 RepID=A0A955RI89_9BACT|nr:FtsW/RodA/SpoVE family cell cycle protein [Candidatus Dojkabacteria bacterium]
MTSRFSLNSFIINFSTTLLLIIGLIAVYSSTFSANTIAEGKGTINKQLVFVIIGIIIYFVLTKINYQIYKLPQIAIIIYLMLLALLVGVLFTDPVNETTRWIQLGFVNIQPSEYAKIVLIILNGAILSGKPESFDKVRMLISAVLSFIKIPIIIVERIHAFFNDDILKLIFTAVITLPVVFLVFIQPSLGNSLIILLIWVLMYFMSLKNQLKFAALIVFFLLGINIFFNRFNGGLEYMHSGINVVLAGTTLAVVLIIGYVSRLKLYLIIVFLVAGFLAGTLAQYVWTGPVLKDYQKERVESLVKSCANETDVDVIRAECWQIRQSTIAIGSGKVWGKGFLKGTQSKLKYLPYAYTDFIFASIAEEFGFVGGLFIILLFLSIILAILFASNQVKERYGSYILIGVFFMFLLHVFVNVGMNIGILPVTGIPLPFISYGGNSVFVNLIAIGIVQSVIRFNNDVDIARRGVLTSESPLEIKSF